MPDNYLCQLCENENVNQRVSNTSIYWIGRCPICNKVIAVSQEHVSNVEEYIFDEMKQECTRLFGENTYKIDLANNHMIGHFHFHILPATEVTE